MQKKHIQNVIENEDSVTITFGKAMPDGSHDKGNSEESNIATTVSSVPKKEKEPIKEEKNNKTEEKMITQKSEKEKLYRVFGFNRKEISKDNRTVNLSFSSEEPYDRSFGKEILSHNPQDVDFSFIASGRAPLLLNHDLKSK